MSFSLENLGEKRFFLKTGLEHSNLLNRSLIDCHLVDCQVFFFWIVSFIAMFVANILVFCIVLSVLVGIF